MDISTLLFSFEGRIGRASYFWATFAMAIVQVFVLALLVRRGVGVEHLMTAKAVLPITLFVASFGWMNCALATKRFHDIGESGWMTLVMILLSAIPGVGLYSVWLVGQLFFKAGDPGRNLFGSPLGGAGDSCSPGAPGGDSGEPHHARAFAAIDELARASSGGGAPSMATLAAPAPTRILPGAAPARALPAPGGFGRRNAGFGQR